MKELTNEDIEILTRKIDKITHKMLIAQKISWFISDELRNIRINLFEAFLLNFEVIQIARLGYTKDNGKVQISTCLSILNQFILSQVFDTPLATEKLRQWGIEAFYLNKEKRNHYIMDKYKLFFESNISDQLLQELVEIRNDYKRLNSDDGPYHTEVFPFHFYNPEELLLKNKKITDLKVKEPIQNLILYLNLKEF